MDTRQKQSVHLKTGSIDNTIDNLKGKQIKGDTIIKFGNIIFSQPNNPTVSITPVSDKKISVQQTLPSAGGVFSNSVKKHYAKSIYSLEKSKASLESNIDSLTEFSTKYFGTNDLMPHSSRQKIATLYDQINLIHLLLGKEYENVVSAKNFLSIVEEINKIDIRSDCNKLIDMFPTEAHKSIRNVTTELVLIVEQSKNELIDRMQNSRKPVAGK